MISLKDEIYTKFWFKYIEYFPSVENKWLWNTYYLISMEMLFQYEMNCFEILSFKDKLKCGSWFEIVFKWLKCGNNISSKDIFGN